MNRPALSIIVALIVGLHMQAQTIVNIPVSQNPVFEVFTDNVDVMVDDSCEEVVLGGNLVIKGGSGTYEFLWCDSTGDTLGQEQTLSVTKPGLYTLYVSDTCQCELSVNFNVESSSVEAVFQSDFSVTPNPTDGVVEISGFDATQITAVDMAGHMKSFICSHDETAIREADFSILSPGMYILTLSNSHGNRKAVRIIKK